MADEQSVIAMAQAHSVLVLVAPRLTLTAARVMEHIKKYAVGTFDGVPG
jgi:hypothetical protein